MAWSSWQSIDVALHYDGPAHYELRIVDNTGTPFPIGRMLGIDPEGILTIGETKCMERRRKQLITGIRQCYGHSECNLLHHLLKYSPFGKIFPNYCLQARYRRVSTKDLAQTGEKVAIKLYICKYGEVPPLNSAIPDRYKDWPVVHA